VETLAPAVIHLSSDGWETTHDTTSRDTAIGVHVTELPAETLPIGARVVFTFYWPDANR
jgi:glucoamylase